MSISDGYSPNGMGFHYFMEFTLPENDRRERTLPEVAQRAASFYLVVISLMLS
jgi:hypothetical protein